MKILAPSKVEKEGDNGRTNKPKFSSFMVLVNSNQTEKSLQEIGVNPEEFQKKLEKAVYANIRKKSNYISRMDPNKELKNTRDIFEIKINEEEFEIGPQKKMFHCHATLTLRFANKGSSFFHVDITKFRNSLLSILPVTDIHLEVQYLPKTNLQQASQYVVKGHPQFNGKTNADGTAQQAYPSTAEEGGRRKRRRGNDGEPPKKRGRPRKNRGTTESG